MIEIIDEQPVFEYVCIEDLVAPDHLLRKIDKHIDFNFIYDKVSHLYCHDNGRPAIDPVRFFKMLLIGYLHGIKSERQLVKEIHHNVAYRWFVGYNLTDKIPSHSTFSQNRKRRFKDASIFQEIFEYTVFLAMKSDLVDGKVLYTDSTHIKAHANHNKFERLEVEKTPQEYIDQLNEDINKDKVAHGKKPLPEKDKNIETKTILQSTIDPESGFLKRDYKPLGFHFLDHRTVDGLNNVITDVFITPGNVNDSSSYISRLLHQVQTFNFNVTAVGLDAGYNTKHICKTLCELGIYATIGGKPIGGKKGYYKRDKFVYDSKEDIYICPNNRVLTYSRTQKNGMKEYKTTKHDCMDCPYFEKCISNKNGIKQIGRHVWEEFGEIVEENMKSVKGKEIFRKRKQTVECSFANSKELHGYRYAKFIGIENMRFQAFMTAIAQNIKKMALIFDRWSKKCHIIIFYRIIRVFSSNIRNYRYKINEIRPAA